MLKNIINRIKYKSRVMHNRCNENKNIKLLNRYGAVIGNDFHCNGKLYVGYGGGEICIANNVTINSSQEYNPTAGMTYSAINMQGGRLIIEDNVGISNTTITCANEIIIEKDVAIGDGTMIADTNFHSLDVRERHMKANPGVRTAPIKICEGAFIGARAIILKGVTIGKEAVIGAGAVVTEDIPDKEVWGGNPARFIKKLN